MCGGEDFIMLANDGKPIDIPAIAMVVVTTLLLFVTFLYYLATRDMARVMRVTSVYELRPYLSIKPIGRQPFAFDKTPPTTFSYHLVNSGKVPANNIVRSYKVFKITGDKTVLVHPYINSDFIFTIAPNEQSEGNPDNITGLRFTEEDIRNKSYYIFELRANYTGIEGAGNISYYSEIYYQIHSDKYFLKYKGDGIDKGLKNFWEWYKSETPKMREKMDCLKEIYSAKTGS